MKSTEENNMTAISPTQLSIVAAFLEKSRDYLDIEHTIRLHWPRRLPRSTASRPQRATGRGRPDHSHAGA